VNSNLFFNCIIFDSFLYFFNRNVLNDFVILDLRNIFSLIFDLIIISDSDFSGDILNNFLFFIIDDCLLVRNILDS